MTALRWLGAWLRALGTFGAGYLLGSVVTAALLGIGLGLAAGGGMIDLPAVEIRP